MRGGERAHNLGRDKGDVPVKKALILQCCETEGLGMLEASYRL